jgi:hypothetical protein
MTKKNEQNNTQPGGGGGINTIPTSATTVTNTNTTSGIVIVHQQTVSEQQQQHFVLSAVNNSAPMIITTPLGKNNLIQILKKFNFSFYLAVPSMITQQLPTTTNAQHPTIAAITNTPAALVAPSSGITNTNTVANTTVQNKATKSPGQDRLVCSLCNKVYRSSAGLRYHKRKRHRGKDIEIKENISRFVYIKMKVCLNQLNCIEYDV